MIRLVVFGALVVIVGLGIAAYTVIGWWAVLAVPLLVSVLGRFLLRPMLKELLQLPFKAKGAVLRGAEVTVHSLVPATPPSEQLRPSHPSDADDVVARTFFHVELTITPKTRGTTFTQWEPAELLLVGPEFVTESDTEDDACVISRVERWEQNGFVEEEAAKLKGAQRLRLLIGVQPPHLSLRLQYYFEQLAVVAIPSTMVPIPVRAANMPQ